MTDTLPPSAHVVPLGLTRRSDPLRVTEAYWAALRQGKELPLRSAVDPRGLQTVLSHVFILERVAQGMARFRIAGSSLSGYAGVELRGLPISALFRLPARVELTEALEACFDRPAIVETKIDAHPIERGAIIPGQMILLPMRCDQGQPTRALGALSFDAKPRSSAYRFDLRSPQFKPIWQARASAPLAAAEPDVAPLRGAPHLRLVHSTE